MRRNRYKQQSNTSSSQGTRNHEQAQRNTNSTPSPTPEAKNPVTPTHCRASSNQENDAKENETNRQLVKWTRAVAILTGGVVFVGVVTVFVLIAHAIIFYQTDETSRQAQRAFVAVREISVVPIGPSVIGPNDIEYHISMFWENSGTTETHEFEYSGTLTQGFGPVPTWPTNVAYHKGVLLPKAAIEKGDISISGTDLNRVRDGQSFFYIFGFAKYRDAFRAKHLTLACFKLRGYPVDYTKEGAKVASAYQCSDYNCADADCNRYKSIPALKGILDYLD
jgi:hypothetical protein